MRVTKKMRETRAKLNAENRKAFEGKLTAKFSIEKATEGGLGLFAITMLRDAGIPTRQCYSPYMGHVGVEVPKRFGKRAEKMIL